MKHFNIVDSNAASQMTNTLPRRLPGYQASWLNGNDAVGLIQQAGRLQAPRVWTQRTNVRWWTMLPC